MQKIPFIDSKLCSDVFNIDLNQVEVSKYMDSSSYITLTRSRASTVLYNFVGHGLSIYNGKVYRRIKIKKNMVGLKLGSLSISKKGGTSVHNSERNAKKMAKMRRKITAKKVRKTNVVKKTTSKAKNAPSKKK